MREINLHIKTSCNAACNLSSGEKIAEQGADRVREQAQLEHVQQQSLQQTQQSSHVKLETAQAVPEPTQISDNMVNARVNQYQQTSSNRFDTQPKDNLGSLINISV